MNFFEAMGGANTMTRWRRRRTPLVSGDYTHPTYAGAGEVGELFSKILLRSLAEHLGQPVEDDAEEDEAADDDER